MLGQSSSILSALLYQWPGEGLVLESWDQRIGLSIPSVTYRSAPEQHRSFPSPSTDMLQRFTGLIRYPHELAHALPLAHKTAKVTTLALSNCGTSSAIEITERVGLVAKALSSVFKTKRYILATSNNASIAKQRRTGWVEDGRT